MLKPKIFIWLEVPVKDEDYTELEMVQGFTLKSARARAKLLYGDVQEVEIQTDVEFMREIFK